MVVMSPRDLGLSQAGTYLKKLGVGGRIKGAYTTNRKHWETIKVFQEPAFRVPLSMAAYRPARRGNSPIPPLPWLQAAIEAGLVEMASLKEVSRGEEFLAPLRGKELPYCSREDLEKQLAEAIAKSLRETSK